MMTSGLFELLMSRFHFINFQVKERYLSLELRDGFLYFEKILQILEHARINSAKIREAMPAIGVAGRRIGIISTVSDS